MKKVLVTGASGFIGRQCIPLLLDRGYEVHALYSKTKIPFAKDVIQHPINLLDVTKIEPLIKKISPSHLLHLAWNAIPGLYWTTNENIDWLQASLQLVKSFNTHGGKRAVFAGTCAEYDWNDGFCSEEKTLLNPSTLYGKCKASLYKELQQQKLNFAWGRIFFLYGPHEHEKRLVPTVINCLLNNQIAKCSHATQKRDFLHVKDVADAFVTLLESSLQGAINIGSGIDLPIKDITTKIGKILNLETLIEYAPKPAILTEPMILKPCTLRLFNELKWRPKINLDNGLNETIQWWKSQYIQDSNSNM